MTLQDIIHEIQSLSDNERTKLIELLLDTQAKTREKKPGKKRSLRELRGLGKEIWAGIDAQEFIDLQRDEWDRQS